MKNLQLFIGVPISGSLATDIQTYQSSPDFPVEMRPSRMQPHITLYPPVHVDKIELESWRSALEEISSAFSATTIKTGIAYFINQAALVLEVESPQLNPVHAAIIKMLGTAPSFAELKPHITIARLKGNFPFANRPTIAQFATDSLSPRQLAATSLRIYGRTNDVPYSVYGDFDFSGN